MKIVEMTCNSVINATEIMIVEDKQSKAKYSIIGLTKKGEMALAPYPKCHEFTAKIISLEEFQKEFLITEKYQICILGE